MSLRSRGWDWFATASVILILLVFVVLPLCSMIFGNWRLW